LGAVVVVSAMEDDAVDNEVVGVAIAAAAAVVAALVLLAMAAAVATASEMGSRVGIGRGYRRCGTIGW